MKILRVLLLIGGIVLAGAGPLPATILTFNVTPGGPTIGSLENNATLSQYGDNVSSTNVTVGSFTFNYLQGSNWTPNVTLAYDDPNGTGGDHTLWRDSTWPGVDYLVNGGTVTANRIHYFIFSPASGFGVRVNSFDLIDYTSYATASGTHNVTWTLHQNTSNGTVIATGNASVAQLTSGVPATPVPVTTGMALGYFGNVVLEINHLTGQGDDLALDNLNFDQVVPEPASAALLTLGGLLLWRRRSQ